MQEVSESWRNTHKKSLLNESFVELSLDVTDPDASKGVIPADNGGANYISNSSYLLGEYVDPSPYCTLEQNLWCLDGKREPVPTSNSPLNGYVSDVLSDDTCVFSSKLPVITLDLPAIRVKLIPGITITWSETYDEFADTFEVVAYNGNNIVATKEVTQNRSVKTIVFVDIKVYDRIDIIVKKWCLPNHRARVEKIIFGLNKVYDKADLFSYSHSQSVDPISASLPKSEIKFSLDNTNGEYNPYNITGIAKYLMEKQELKVRYGLKLDNGSVEWIKGGTFYLSEWYAKQNGLTADFTARDIFEFLSDTYSDDSRTVKSLYDRAYDILSTASLPTDAKWVIDESLKDIEGFAPLPEDTRANWLQLIANAGMCAMYQDREGTLRIEPLSDETNTDNGTDYEINSFNSYSRSEVTLSKPVKMVRVKVYKHSYSDENGWESNSYYSVARGIPGVTNGEIVEVDNPLITTSIDSDGIEDTSHPDSVAEWIASHLAHRMTLDSSWRADVRLDALDIVKNENDYGNNRVRVTDVEFKYNGAFRGTAKGKVI